jgi:5,10-methylenetetrahydromethanopterin reductase
VRVGLRLPPCRRVDELATAARRAEELAFDAVWFPDSQLLWRDVYVTLALAATQTQRITLGTAVTNVSTRHPTVLAGAIRTVQELAPDRFVLGIGVGDSALRPLGLPPTSRAALQSKLMTIRELARSGAVDFGGGEVRVRDAAGPFPVYMAANGPHNLALAGALSDGVILLSGVSERALERSLGFVRSGAQAAGRVNGPRDVVVSAYTHVTDDVERDARRLKPIIAAIAQTGGTGLLTLAGIDPRVPDRVPEVYPDLVHAEDWETAVDVCGHWVSDADAVAFGREFCLFGNADELVERILAIGAAGATALLLQHVGSYDLPVALMDELGATVLPRLATG